MNADSANGIAYDKHCSSQRRYSPTRQNDTILCIKVFLVALVFASVFALVTASLMGQIAAGIHIRDVRFRGNTPLRSVDLRKCANDLMARDYEGPNWLATIAEHVRATCLQDKGYFKATVVPSARQLPDKNATHQFIITLDIEAGQQYRTGDVTFKGNHAFSDAELRSMFPLKSGDIFSLAPVREGLARMRSAYVGRGYPNFTPIPDTTIDDSGKIVSLTIDCDEVGAVPPFLTSE
jgi:hypothetical protein